MNLAVHLTLIHLTLSSADGRSCLEDPVVLGDCTVFVEVLDTHDVGPSSYLAAVWRGHDFVPIAATFSNEIIQITSFCLDLISSFAVRNFSLHKTFLNLFLTDEISLPLFRVRNGLLRFRVYVILRYLFEVSWYYAGVCDGALNKRENTQEEGQNISRIDEGKIKIPLEFGCCELIIFVLVQVPFVSFVLDEPEVIVTQLYDAWAYRHKESTYRKIPLRRNDAPSLGTYHLKVASGFTMEEILRDLNFLVHVKTGDAIFFQSFGEVTFFAWGSIVR